jgi:hypothetical protein
MLDALRRFGATVGGRYFRMAEFDAWPERPCCAVWIAHCFGKWPVAMAKAGFVRDPRCRYGAAELMQRLEQAWRKIGCAPGQVTIRQYAGVTERPYARIWGSLPNACAQLVRYHRTEISREELLRGGPMRRRGSIRAGMRWQVFTRDGNRCVVCGSRAADGVTLEVDHIMPLSRGGGNEMPNLRTLCATCNRGKSDQMPESRATG